LCERLAADGRSLRVGAECEYFLVQLANYLRALTMETTMLARACGKSDVHRLEPEDLVALTVEAAVWARSSAAPWVHMPRHDLAGTWQQPTTSSYRSSRQDLLGETIGLTTTSASPDERHRRTSGAARPAAPPDE
jgi:hypothetical protein